MELYIVRGGLFNSGYLGSTRIGYEVFKLFFEVLPTCSQAREPFAQLEERPHGQSVAGLPVACAQSVLIELMCKQETASHAKWCINHLGFSDCSLSPQFLWTQDVSSHVKAP